MTKVAVIGAGVMGANHARVLRAMPECELVAVVDPDPDRGAAVARSVGAQHLADPSDVIGIAEAAVLATPSETHAALGVPLLEAGTDLLVEKPIASDLEDARQLVEAAASHERVLMVGHIERFNPAVLELRRLLEEPLHIEMTRIGPFSPRVSTDVVLDLMIHDLDLALSIAGCEIVNASATGRAVATDTLDLASALLTFANGMTVTLTASRVAQTKVRQIEITQRETFVSVDLVRQDVTIHRLHHSEFLTEGGPVYRQSGLVEIPFLEQRGEPLALELRAFLACVRDRTQSPVSGLEGLRALDLALALRSAAVEGRP